MFLHQSHDKPNKWTPCKWQHVNDKINGCSVCLCEFEEGDVLRVLQPPGCGHAFHQDCIDKWFILHITCPLCRHKLGFLVWRYLYHNSHMIDHLQCIDSLSNGTFVYGIATILKPILALLVHIESPYLHKCVSILWIFV